jgi:hypothetical protein
MRKTGFLCSLNLIEGTTSQINVYILTRVFYVIHVAAMVDVK